MKFGGGLSSSCGDERINISTTNHGDRHDAVTNNRAHPGRQDRCGSSASRLDKGGTRETPNRERIAFHVFGFKYLQQHFGSKREFVAKSFGGKLLLAISLLFSTNSLCSESLDYSRGSNTTIPFFMFILAYAVRVSSFKRTTRHHGIHQWPNRIRNIGNSSLSFLVACLDCEEERNHSPLIIQFWNLSESSGTCIHWEQE